MLVGGIWVECIYKNKLFAKDIFKPDSKQLCSECLRPSTLDPLWPAGQQGPLQPPSVQLAFVCMYIFISVKIWHFTCILYVYCVILRRLRCIWQQRKYHNSYSWVTCVAAASSDLPEHESECVHVGALEWLKVSTVDGLIQHLGCHVAACAHTVVGRYVHWPSVHIMLHR